MRISSIIFSCMFLFSLACSEEAHRENSDSSNNSDASADKSNSGDTNKEDTSKDNTSTSSSDNANTNNTSSQVTSNPKPYAVSASLTGKTNDAHSMNIQGETDTPADKSFSASVGLSDLVIYLLGSDGSLISIIIDTEQSPLPDSVSVGDNLDSAAFITLASMGTIYESVSGTVDIDACPEKDATIVGKFNNISLKNVMDESSYTLTGSFKVKIWQSDNTQKCKEVVNTTDGGGTTQVDDNDNTASSDDTSTTQTCEMGTCDGPCCPYQQCMVTCELNCMTTTCSDPLKGMECITCFNDCLTSCNVSQECIDKLTAINTCERKNGCEELEFDQQDACSQEFCCTENKAAF